MALGNVFVLIEMFELGKTQYEDEWILQRMRAFEGS